MTQSLQDDLEHSWIAWQLNFERNKNADSKDNFEAGYYAGRA